MAEHPTSSPVDTTDGTNAVLGNVPERLLRYYREAGPDYSAWSRGLHMHFGFWRLGINPMRLERLLEEMTHQVYKRLDLDGEANHRLVDLGCGYGSSARLLARVREGLEVHGVTLVPSQAVRAWLLTEVGGLADRVRFVQSDYTSTPYPDGCFDGAYAIESACHSQGAAKEKFVREAARLVRSGGRLAIADGFLKTEAPMNPLLSYCYRQICDNWAVDNFAIRDRMASSLQEHGFEDLQVEEISWRIAPSVMHIPWVTTRFLLQELRKSRLRMNRVRWGHIKACVLAPVVGMARRHYGYYLMYARRT